MESNCVKKTRQYLRPDDNDQGDDGDDDVKDDDGDDGNDDDGDDELKASMSDAIIRSSPAALPHRAEQREKAQPLTFSQINKKKSLFLFLDKVSVYIKHLKLLRQCCSCKQLSYTVTWFVKIIKIIPKIGKFPPEY